MQASQPNKPYFIEFYAADSTLRNKFKFVISAVKVGELKEQVKLRLIGKKELQADTEIVMKDNDDFQLASDDEVQDVVTDSKVKIYLKAKSIPQPVAVVPSVPVPPPIVIVKDLEKLCQSTALDLANFKIPVIAADIKHRLLVRAPQIPNSAIIQIPVTLEIGSFFELSKHIVSQLGLSASLKALLYNQKGQPFFYNLDLMNFPLPKLDFSEQMWVIFTDSPSTLDTPVVKPIQLSNKLTKISIQRGTDRFNLEIDLQNKVEVLRYKIYQIIRFHPLNQVIKFAGKIISNFDDSLKNQGIVNDSIIQVAFKQIGNLVPCTFADKFYYKDIKHIREQSVQGITQLRATLLTLAAHLSSDDKIKFVNFVRSLTKNNPLTFGLKSLFSNNFISQVHRIAIEEGLLVALGEYLLQCKPQPHTLNWKEAFTKFRDFVGFLMEGSLKIVLNEQIKTESKCLEVQRNCNITMGPIKIPRAYILDDGSYTIIDKEAFQNAVLKGFTYPNLKSPKKENIITLPGFEEYFYQYLNNQLDNPNTNALFWIGFKSDHPVFGAPLIENVQKYRQSLENYPELKVHQPLEIKNKSSTYLLLKNKEGKLKVFVSRNKDISRPFNLFDVITGLEEAVNLDLMGANVRSQNVEQVIDLGNLKPVITRPPKEAIAVLFDVSGSMAGQFFNEPDLKRIGAVKSFFEAFAYRTIAYNLQHVVSLFFFDHNVQNQCGFTEAIYDFNRLIAKAAPKGSTLMYDAVVKASEALLKFKIEHPDCLLRIVALTDGEDTGSHHSIELTTNILVKSNITIDSFAVGANCQGLKIISIASGGKCYLTRNLEESLKLFEQETVLSVRARKVNDNISKLTIEERIIAAKSMPFDLPNTVHQFKMPEAQVGLSAKDMIKKINNEGQGGKANSNGSLKRIAKEIQNYSDNPHPFVAIFPCSNINLWKILLLGPKSTPYENGLFLLYAQFPGDYPFKAPEVRFITPIYHCNMNSQGRICHSVFDRNYSPALTFRHIIDCVYGLILTPEPEDPLDNVIASFYLSDYQTYLKNAKQFTLDKASLTTEKIVDQLFGKIVDDIQRKQKEKQIEQWITLAKSFN